MSEDIVFQRVQQRLQAQQAREERVMATLVTFVLEPGDAGTCIRLAWIEDRDEGARDAE